MAIIVEVCNTEKDRDDALDLIKALYAEYSHELDLDICTRAVHAMYAVGHIVISKDETTAEVVATYCFFVMEDLAYNIMRYVKPEFRSQGIAQR